MNILCFLYLLCTIHPLMSSGGGGVVEGGRGRVVCEAGEGGGICVYVVCEVGEGGGACVCVRWGRGEVHVCGACAMGGNPNSLPSLRNRDTIP